MKSSSSPTSSLHPPPSSISKKLKLVNQSSASSTLSFKKLVLVNPNAPSSTHSKPKSSNSKTLHSKDKKKGTSSSLPSSSSSSSSKGTISTTKSSEAGTSKSSIPNSSISTAPAKSSVNTLPNSSSSSSSSSQRVLCGCKATVHGLLNNCLNCGYISCTQERRGPCLFCSSSSFSLSGDSFSSRTLVPSQEVIHLKQRLLFQDQTSKSLDSPSSMPSSSSSSSFSGTHSSLFHESKRIHLVHDEYEETNTIWNEKETKGSSSKIILRWTHRNDEGSSFLTSILNSDDEEEEGMDST